MTNVTPLNLDSLADFDTKTREDWDALVEKGLRGKAPETLTSHTEDNIARGPLTTLDNSSRVLFPSMRSNQPLLEGRPWHICAPVEDSDLAFANAQLLEDLKGGASAARVTLSKDGLHLSRSSDFDRLFDEVRTDLIPISFRGFDIPALNAVFDIPTLTRAHVTLGLDIVRHSGAISDVLARCPETWRALTVSTAGIHNAGATDGQELAAMAGYIVCAMNTVGPEAAHRHMAIEIAVDRDAHLTISKVRAARRIYARIAQSYGLADKTIPLYTVTSKRMMQSVDPWTNMLRTMSAGFGAIVGGADYVTLMPFTEALGTPTPFGHRIARNMQLMMMEESHLGQVDDPAYGSYFHDRMSDELAQKAWQKFQAIEASGGIETYLSSGVLAKDCEIASEKRGAENAPILGVTLHKADTIRDAKVRRAKS